MSAPLADLLGLAIGAALGWLAREAWTRREAERFVTAMLARDAKERRARMERIATWHIEAETDAEAWAQFHQRARIGAGEEL